MDQSAGRDNVGLRSVRIRQISGHHEVRDRLERFNFDIEGCLPAWVVMMTVVAIAVVLIVEIATVVVPAEIRA